MKAIQLIYKVLFVFLFISNSLAQPPEFKVKPIKVKPFEFEKPLSPPRIIEFDKIEHSQVKFAPPLLPIIGETYIVVSQTLNIREEPSKNSTIISKLKQGDKVRLLNVKDSVWWYVKWEAYTRYVSSEFLREDIFSWEKKNYESGTTPECENVTPQHDFTLNNYLKINVGSGTDVVVKLMKIGTYEDVCIRIVYVRSSESYDIINIPEGNYYLKIAFGKDYRQKIIDNQCYVRFINNPQYEKGKDILDFNKVNKPDEVIGDKIYKRWSIPSYTLNLDVISSFKGNRFDANKITEKEFNQ